ncbi:hypothetical protein VNI00_002116 [Paramarasmius palmivorus]|uniref:Uncharacterized protein n=1 Tax=Paramarasmius palmivorus TaxID=297713 RepID=A0AAW0E711_9AGAR
MAHPQNNIPIRSSMQTECSFSTEAESRETLDGPGALSARYIEALGKVTLKGIDRVTDYVKLRTIKRSFPDLSGDVPSDVYDSLLEFCRPGLYHPQIQEQVLGLVMAQIAMRHVTNLLRRLIRWPLEHLQRMLVELALCLEVHWQNNPNAKSAQQNAAQVYTSTLQASELHPVMPFFDFLLCFAQVGPDYLECVLAPLRIFQELAVVYHHPLSIYTNNGLHRHSSSELSLSSTTMTYQPRFRRYVWSVLGVGYIKRQLDSMIQKQKEGNLEGNELFEACINGIDFFLCNLDHQITDDAFNFILRSIMTQFKTLSLALSLFSENDQLDVVWEILNRINKTLSGDYDMVMQVVTLMWCSHQPL